MSETSSERKFLHDLSSPIATALFLADVLAENLPAGSTLSEVDAQQLKTLLAELDRVKTLIQRRRETLIQSES